VGRGVTALLGVGFFAALVVAWYHGEKGAQRVTAVEVLMLAGILVVAAAAVSWAGLRPAGGAAVGVAPAIVAPAIGAPPIEAGSIAVLPFENLSDDPAQEYFSAGITDDILTTLSRMAELKVISRTSSMQYRGTDKPLPQIGAELGVAHVLEGRVRRQGDRVRITAQLIDARTDRHLWAETYDRELRDVFQIQMEVAQRIAEALRVALQAGAADRVGRAPTADLAAYDLYLRSRELGATREGNAAAVALLREATRLDPEFAGAHAALAARLAQRIDLYSFPADSAETGLAVASRAIELDEQLPEAYRALADNLWYAGRYADAAAASRRALELDPNDAWAMELLFWSEYYQGRRDEALRWALRGYRVNPRLAPLPGAIAVVYTDVGAHTEAERWVERGLELDPHHLWTHWTRVRLDLYLGRTEAARRRAEALLAREPGSAPALVAAGDAAAYSGDWDQAVRHYRQAYDLAPESSFYVPTRLVLAMGLIRAGDRAGAAPLLEAVRREAKALREHDPTDIGGAWRLGVVRALEGDAGEALAWLERAFDQGWIGADQARRSPLFDGLRQHPRFLDLVGRLDGRQAEWRRRLEAIAATEAGGVAG
jgi:TolB-like protein/Flp pilus assembly protein TadD